jgi:hypothetical protein
MPNRRMAGTLGQLCELVSNTIPFSSLMDKSPSRKPMSRLDNLINDKL